MTEFMTQNNIKVVMNHADMAAALRLKRAFFKTAMESGIDINDLIKQAHNNKSITDLDIDFNSFLSGSLALLASPEIDAAVMSCLSRCTYNKEKISEATFDNDEKAREDYYEIAGKCLEVNLRPFLKGLVSWLKGLFREFLPAEFLKSE